MNTRQLGHSGLEVSDIGFGCMSLTSQDQAKQAITAAIRDRGMRIGLDVSVVGTDKRRIERKTMVQPLSDN